MNISFSSYNSNHPFEFSNMSTLRPVIDMLKEYQQNCLKTGDLYSAEETKQKITYLKHTEEKYKHQFLVNKNKENKQIVEKQSQQEIFEFEHEWQEKIKQIIGNLQKLEQKMKKQHKAQLEELEKKLSSEQIPKVKFSPKVLKLRHNFQNLLKVRQYLEAEYIKHELTTLQMIETEKWNQVYQQKKKKQHDQLIKKHETELKALKVKIKTMFNQKIKEKQEKFLTLIKKQQKRKIEASKCGPQIKIIQNRQNKMKLLMSKTMNLRTSISRSRERRKPFEELNKSKQKL